MADRPPFACGHVHDRIRFAMTTSDAPNTPLPRRPVWRPGLFLVGLLLLAAPFLYANPYAGSQRKVWPWDVWTLSTSWDARTELFGIALVAIGAIAAGLGVGRGRLLACVTALAAFFAIRLHGEAATFSLLSVERLGLSWFGAGLALGTGLLVLSRRDGVARRAGIGLTVLGSVWIVTFLVAWFPRDTSARGRSMLEYYVRRVPDFWNAIVRRGETDASARAAIIPLAWSQVVPTIFLALSVVLGLPAAILAWFRSPRASRVLAVAAFVAFLCTWLIPLGSALLGVREAGELGLEGVFGTVGNALLDAGMALWLVLALALSSMLRESLGTGFPPPESAAPERSALDRRVFGAVFLLGAVSLVAHFHPRAGIAAHAWPTEYLRRFGWDAAGSALVFHVLFLSLALAAAIVRPSRGTGWMLAAGFGAALIALEGPVRDETELRRFLFRAPPYVPFILAGIAAGAAGAVSSRGTDRLRRGIALIAGLGLLALLLYPVAAPVVRRAPGAPVEMERYLSVLTAGWEWAAGPIEFLFGFEPRFGCPMTTTWLALVGATAVAAGLSAPARVRRVGAWTLLGLASAWPMVQLAGGAFHQASVEGATLSGRLAALWGGGDLPLQCAAAVAYFYLPTAWAVAGLVARFVRGKAAPGVAERPMTPARS